MSLEVAGNFVRGDVSGDPAPPAERRILVAALGGKDEDISAIGARLVPRPREQVVHLEIPVEAAEDRGHRSAETRRVRPERTNAIALSLGDCFLLPALEARQLSLR